MTAAAATTAAPEPAAHRRTTRSWLPTWAVGAGLALLQVVVTWQVRPHPRWNDGIFVFNDAASFPDANRALDQHALRVGNLLPTRLFLELFGYGQVAYYAWPFLTGILLVVAVFALGVVLFDRWTAAAAAVLLVFHPALVDTVIKAGSERMTSWQLLPDIPSTAFMTLGFALLLGAAARRGSGPARPGDAAPTWWYLLAGFCFGYAYLIRELSVFFYPLVLGALVAWRLPLRRWVQVALPMLATLVFELVLNQLAHGDAFVRLEVGGEHGSPPLTPLTRVDALLRFPRIVVVYPQTIVVLTSLVLLVLGALVVRRRAQVFLLAWFVVIWLPLTLVSGLLDPTFIRINASLMRYWVPVLPALVLGAAGFVSWALAVLRARLPARRRGVGVAVTAAVTALGLAVAVVPLLRPIARNPRDQAWNAMRSYLAANDRRISTIITDDRDALILGIYRREPIGGEVVVHARVEKVGHTLAAPPESPGDPGTYLIWTPTLSRKRPQAADGWRLVLKRFQLRLYAPTTPR